MRLHIFKFLSFCLVSVVCFIIIWLGHNVYSTYWGAKDGFPDFFYEAAAWPQLSQPLSGKEIAALRSAEYNWCYGYDPSSGRCEVITRYVGSDSRPTFFGLVRDEARSGRTIMLVVEVEQETDVDGKECLVFSEGLDNIKIATAINPSPNKLHSNVSEIYQSERRKNELRRLASSIFLAFRNQCTHSQRIGTTVWGTPIIYDRTTRSDVKGRTTVEYAIAHLLPRDGVGVLDLLLR